MSREYYSQAVLQLRLQQERTNISDVVLPDDHEEVEKQQAAMAKIPPLLPSSGKAGKAKSKGRKAQQVVEDTSEQEFPRCLPKKLLPCWAVSLYHPAASSRTDKPAASLRKETRSSFGIKSVTYFSMSRLVDREI